MLVYPSFQRISTLALYAEAVQTKLASSTPSSTTFVAADHSENEAQCLTQNLATNAEYASDDLATFSIIPAVSNPTHEFPEWHEPQYADQIPIGFHGHEWIDIWNGPRYEIDKYLMHGINLWTGEESPWFHEYDFMGIQWRLAIDHRKSLKGLPHFYEGMIISFDTFSSRNYQYVIDHCAHVDDVNAYLKLICYKRTRRFCTSWSKYPPVLLAVPIKYNCVRMHDNSHSATPSDADSGEMNVGWRGKFKKLRKMMQAPWRQISRGRR